MLLTLKFYGFPLISVLFLINIGPAPIPSFMFQYFPSLLTGAGPGNGFGLGYK